jgi:hypothetical protein
MLAEVVTMADPNVIGFAVTSLVGSMAAAGAAVAVTYYFLSFLRNEGLKWNRREADRSADFDAAMNARRKDFLTTLERMAAESRDALADQRRSFRDELTTQIAEGRSTTADCMMVLKALMDRLDGAESDVSPRELRQALGGLQASINGIDVMVRRMVEIGVEAKRDPRAKPIAVVDDDGARFNRWMADARAAAIDVGKKEQGNA